jgi:hypothetical protein
MSDCFTTAIQRLEPEVLGGDDICRCPACAPDGISSGTHRGPLQCETRTLDPLDAAAMRAVEGGAA